jgi:hypothetical protein
MEAGSCIRKGKGKRIKAKGYWPGDLSFIHYPLSSVL